MFTGIIETTAKVLQIEDGTLILERPSMFDDIKIGSSIAVSGVCLSVIEFNDKTIKFDVVPETFSKTTMSALKKGDSVNLERAMKAGDRFEGHIVQGHVEGTAEVLSTGAIFTFRVQKEIKKFLINKGSITIDGISLTIAEIRDDTFGVALIPHTLATTTMGMKKPGERVNIETDMLVRAVLDRQTS